MTYLYYKTSSSTHQIKPLPITRLARKVKKSSKKVSAIAKGGEIVAKGFKKKKKKK